MQNLSIISSPLQLLNFKEFVSQTESDKFYLVVLYYYDQELLQIKNLASYLDIRINKIVKAKKFLQYFWLRSLRSRFINCNKLIIGNFFSAPHLYLLNLIKPKQVFVLDDGMNTLLIHEKLKSKQPILKSNIIRDVIFYFLKINTNYPSRFKLFTFFYKEKKNKVDCILNKLTFTRGKIFEIEEVNKTFFIGQPFVEFEMMEETQYIKYLKSIKKTYGDIIYIPSRKENKNKIEKLTREINLTVLYPEFNIEIYFLINKLLPKTVISFTSTALVLLNKIFNTNEKLVDIKSIYFSLSNERFDNNTYEKYYTLFQNHGIEIMKIK